MNSVPTPIPTQRATLFAERVFVDAMPLRSGDEILLHYLGSCKAIKWFHGYKQEKAEEKHGRQGGESGSRCSHDVSISQGT